MGITGLLPFLKKASREVNVRNFSGATVAVDAHCWLHKGAFSCAEKIGKGEQTDGYVQFCVKMVNSLLAAGVVPILVFDGCKLPSKDVTNKRRKENKIKYKQLAKNHLLQGNLKEARECFQRCVEITSQMALQALQACRKLGVDCVVAPYEADAQLAYLNKIGIAQIVITEDSDLVLYGCDRILYKMDANGNGILLESSKINLCLGVHANNFTFTKFRQMCILSGCDYLPSLPGIGLGKACKFFAQTTNPDLNAILPKIPYYLKMPNLFVNEEYKRGFIQAENTFLYQLVFDPFQRRLVPLNPYPPDVNPETLDYAGKRLEDEVAYRIAVGNIDVNSMEVVDDFDPQVDFVAAKSTSWKQKITNGAVMKSIWSTMNRNSFVQNDREVDENEARFTVKAKFSSSPSTKSLRPAAQKRNCREPSKQQETSATEFSNKDLVAQYGDSKRIKRDKNDDDRGDAVLPSPIIRCRYFTSPKVEAPADETVPSDRTLEMSSDSTIIYEHRSGVETSSQRSVETSHPDASPIVVLKSSAAYSIGSTDEISTSQPICNDFSSKIPSATGQLMFDRAMKTRTSLPAAASPSSSSSSPSPSPSSGEQKTPSISGGKNFKGRWQSLRTLYEFKSSSSLSTSNVNTFEELPSNHTTFKPVLAKSRSSSSPLPPPPPEFSSIDEGADSSICSQSKSEEFVTANSSSPSSSPFCSFLLSPPSSLPSSDPNSVEAAADADTRMTSKPDRQVVTTPRSLSQVLRQDNKTRQKKCRVSGLTRKKSIKVQSSTLSSTPKCKQLSLKESLAKFNYQKSSGSLGVTQRIL